VRLKTPGGLHAGSRVDPDISAITNLINTWIHIGQALVASVGALAFICALVCMPLTLLSD
jgi:hypothetical protein